MIIFDLMGCIFKTPHIIKNILYPLMEDRIIYSELKKIYLKYSNGELTREEFLRTVPLDIEEKFLDKIELDDNAKEIFDYLKGKEYSMGVLSNIPDHIGNYVVRENKIENYFKVMVFSGTYGLRKPNEALYKIFLEKSGADPKNCFFIDDKLENLKTAKDLGIKTIWKRIGKSNSFSIHNFKPDFTIASLLELKKILV
ncbi:MAG: HAD-IA family hydrolase [Candidatus Aenigmarchaeota archaeon]|nr:HAD-IA family hydrolase [Candidatus Aenigmarchaeota archaeon]